MSQNNFKKEETRNSRFKYTQNASFFSACVLLKYLKKKRARAIGVGGEGVVG